MQNVMEPPIFEPGDRVFHVNGFVQRRWRVGMVIGTAHTHPWDCAPGMVIVQPHDLDVKHGVTIPIRLLQLAEEEAEPSPSERILYLV